MVKQTANNCVNLFATNILVIKRTVSRQDATNQGLKNALRMGTHVGGSSTCENQAFH